MNKLTIKYEDAVNSLKMFHSLPNGIEIEILPELGAMPQKVKDLYHFVYKNWSSKIPCIKEVRSQYNLGLKDSKSFIDEVFDDCSLSSNIMDPSIYTETYFYNMLKQHNIEK